MANWKNININDNLVEHETARAVLIRFPKSSEFKGYTFWHPLKCIHEGRHSASFSLGYTDEWDFTIKKTGKKSFKVLDERSITVEEFEEAFGVVNENIQAPIKKNIYETHKPEEKEAEEVETLKELVD